MVIPTATGSNGAGTLQKTLQAVVQSVQWTYSLFWHLCPQQGVLVWGDGYYNGAIKTRKTVQPVEVSTEEASLQRSQQLRELYESLSSGEANLPARRPCAALSPEDLTEAEWFYLMCISFSFPPAVGLPGKAFAQQRYVWLTGANEVDSKVFSRAILAKSAQIQTVVCIPLVDGVLELGNVEKVEEDAALIQLARRFFGDYLDTHTKPVLSEHSTSNPLFQQPPAIVHHQMSIDFHGRHEEDADHDLNDANYDEDDDDEDDDGDEEDGDDVEGSNCRSGGQRILRSNSAVVGVSESLMAVEEVVNEATTSELMQVEMSEEEMRVGSASDCSNGSQSKAQMQDDHLYRNWHFLLEDLGTQLQDFSPEDAHYSETVSSILRHNLKRWMDVASFGYLIHSAHKSSFLKWSHKRDHCYNHHHPRPEAVHSSSQKTSQWLVKRVLLNIRELHSKFSDASSSPRSRDGEGGNRISHKGTTNAQEEGSANHVLAERRRREKLNERFMILRSLVPFVTKMDKASILGDTIEYVNQLRRHIQDLEAKNKQIESYWRLNRTKQQQSTQKKGKPSGNEQEILDRLGGFEKRKVRVLDSNNNRVQNPPKISEAATSVRISVVESEVVLELQCSFRDGLLLRILQTLQELGLEVTSLQYSSTDGVSNVELRSQMKDVQGKIAGIDDVRKAIHQIIV